MITLAFTRPLRRLDESIETAKSYGFEVVAGPSLDIIHGLKSLRRHKNDFDMLVLRDYTLGMLVFHPEWNELVGNRPVAVINTSKQFPTDFDRLPNIYRFSFPMSLIPTAIEFFFVHHNRLPGGVTVKRCKATLAKKSNRTDYWE